MIDEELFTKLCEYFEGRPELVDSVHFTAFSRAKERTLDFVLQERDVFDRGMPKQAPITIGTMLGFPDQKQSLLDGLQKPAKECASKLYKFNPENIEVRGVYLMTDGSSLPVRVDVSIKNGDESAINKTMYLKPFDPVRLLGIELYRLIGGIEEDYGFFFNRGIVVEDNIEGRHEFDISEDLKSGEVYVASRVREDIVSFYMGLDDLVKHDNYVIAHNGRIKVIDFDKMDTEYSEEEKARIKSFTAKGLGITIDEYNELYAKEEERLKRRIQEHKDDIYRICDIFESSEDDVTAGIGKYIRKNTEKMLEEH